MWGGEIMNLIDNISIILKIVSKLQMLSFYGCSNWDGMVITGHRYSKSTFGANKSNFPIGTTQKKISVSELGVIFWGSPLFLAVLG